MSLPSRKLTPLFVGPFKILRFKGENAVELELGKRFQQLSRVQNLEYIRPYYRRTPDIGTVHDPPGPILIDGQEEFEVEDILAHRYAGNRLQYLIQWKGRYADEDSWEPAAEIRRNCGDLTREYQPRQSSYALRERDW